MLLFRGWLGNNSKDKKRYKNDKRVLAAQKWKHVQNDAAAKTKVAREILQHAQNIDLCNCPCVSEGESLD